MTEWNINERNKFHEIQRFIDEKFWLLRVKEFFMVKTYLPRYHKIIAICLQLLHVMEEM